MAFRVLPMPEGWRPDPPPPSGRRAGGFIGWFENVGTDVNAFIRGIEKGLNLNVQAAAKVETRTGAGGNRDPDFGAEGLERLPVRPPQEPRLLPPSPVQHPLLPPGPKPRPRPQLSYSYTVVPSPYFKLPWEYEPTPTPYTPPALPPIIPWADTDDTPKKLGPPDIQAPPKTLDDPLRRERRIRVGAQIARLKYRRYARSRGL